MLASYTQCKKVQKMPTFQNLLIFSKLDICEISFKKSVMNEPYSKLRNLRKELGRNNYKIIEATRHI